MTTFLFTTLPTNDLGLLTWSLPIATELAARGRTILFCGGYGSCQTGLYTGTPAVTIPTYAERESNARRIAALGAGAIVSVEHASGGERVRVDELRATARRMLTDPSFTANARRMSERLRAYGGARQAAYVIDRFSLGWNDSNTKDMS